MNGQMKQFFEETSMHGFRYLFGTSIARKVMWVALLTFAIIVMIVQMKKQIEAYNLNPIQTNIDIDYKQTLTFPAITICNNNQYKISQAARYGVYEMLEELYEEHDDDGEEHHFDFTHFERSLQNLGDSRQFHQTLTSSIHDMLIKCRLPDGHTCTADDFDLTFTDFGICYTINGNKHNPMTVQKSGERTGLYVLLNLEAYEIVPGPSNTMGIKIMIYNQTDVPTVATRAIDLPPGYHSQIGINRVVKNKIRFSDGGSCIDQGPHPITYYNSDHEYSNEKCAYELLWAEIRQKCGCDAYNSPTNCVWDAGRRQYSCKSHKQLSVCPIEESFECALETANEQDLGNKTQKCRENCTTIEHRARLSMSALPMDTIVRLLPPSTLTQMQQSYFESLEARRRVSERHRIELMSILNEYTTATATIRAMQLEPTSPNFKSSFVRLTETVCHPLIFNDPDFSPLFRTFGPDPFGNLPSFHNTMSAAVHLRALLGTTVNGTELLSEYEHLMEDNTKRIEKSMEGFESTVTAFSETLSYFDEAHYHKELRSNLSSYVLILEHINDYKTGRITLRQLSDYIQSVSTLFIPTLQTEFISTLGQMNFGNGYWYRNAISLQTSDSHYAAALLMGATEPSFVTLFAVTLMGDQFANPENTDCDQIILDACPLDYDEHPELMNETMEHKIEEALHECEEIYELPSTTVVRELLCPIKQTLDPAAILAQLVNCASTEVFDLAVQFEHDVQLLTPLLSKPWNKLASYTQSFLTLAQMDDKFYRENILAFNVHYKDLSEELYIQTPSYGIWSLACDIGGTLGLFLGASIMAFGELVDFFVLRPIFNRGAKCMAPKNQQLTGKVQPSEIYPPANEANVVAPVLPIAEGATSQLVT